MSVGFDASELDKLASDFAAAAPKVKRSSSAEMTKVAAQFRDDAKAAAPVDTGETRASIRVQGRGNSRTIIADTRAAFFQEFGTSDTPPQPFMWPQIPKATERLAEALEKIADPFD